MAIPIEILYIIKW